MEKKSKGMMIMMDHRSKLGREGSEDRDRR